MAFFTGLKAIFTSQKSIDKALDISDKITTGAISGIDKLWYTSEEKAENAQKASETLLKFWEVIENENTEQSIARREIAKMTFKVYFFLLLAGVTVYKFDIEYAKFIFEVAGTLTGLVMGIGAIYFGPQQISKIWQKEKNKKRKKPDEK